MACSYARSLVFSASKVLKMSTKTFARSRSCVLQNCMSVNPWLQRGFTRSHWVLCGEKQIPGAVNVGMNTTCSCSRLHTEVDKELVEFLDKEISLEKETSKKRGVPNLADFQAKTDGANVTLTRKLSDETITIKFNINNSVDADGLPEAEEYDQSQGEIPNMISKPPFIVELNKGGKRTLSVQCSFPPPEGMSPDQSAPPETEQIVDSYEINEVALHEGEWEEEVYSLQSDVMDGNLYDLLMDMLDERGINEEFTSNMVQYATGYEHAKYLEFLENLKTFTKGN
ncbi:complement component 1 Q subcomponent-binding protein, mitochondrial-like [Liolophura sinensis]|uniref:complement component 1 Q subcomponent-binding protein, mitochondrial-like n=1 Tax=Liolophura sinensis TaxID=3198878 RepID=UPI0031590A95